MEEADRVLARVLVERGVVTQKQVDECLRLRDELTASGAPVPGLGELLVKRGYLSSRPDEGLKPGASFGRYVLDRKLGEGGMGEVWRARDPALGRDVALKFLKGADPEVASRFQREAQLAASLNHPNIAAVYEVGTEAGRSFIAMQYVAGATLVAFPRGDRRKLATIVRDAARAVHAAHERGIIHRDLKPANVMVDGDRVYVMDFGLAKASHASRVTASNVIMGTPAYMSPEQVRDVRAVDARTDVYALGATLYEVLAGRPPFEGEHAMDVLDRVVRDEPPPLRGVPADLSTIAMKCLEKRPSSRYASARELADDLTRWLAGEPIAARPPSAAERALRWARRHRVAAATGAVVLVAAGALAWIVPRWRAEAERRQAHEEAAKLFEAGRAALEEAWRRQFRAGVVHSDIASALDRGQPLIDRGVALAPDAVLGHYLAGWAWELRDEPERAEQCLRRALELDASFGPARYRLGRVLLQRGRLMTMGTIGDRFEPRSEMRQIADDAIRELDAALRAPGALDNDVDRAMAQALAAHARLDRDAVLRVDAEWRDRLKGREGSEELLLIFAQNRWTEEAVELMREAVALRPGYALGHFALGYLQAQTGGVEAAIASYTRAVEINPRFAEAYDNRGLLKRRLGDLEGALEDYARALQANPRLITPYLNRSLIHAMRGEFDRARADCDRALALRPTCAPALQNRAFVRRSTGDVDGAIADCTRALEIDPNLIGAWVDRARERGLRGDDRGAREDLEAAVRVTPRFATEWFQRAHAREKLGDLKGALADYDEALRSEGGRGDFRRARGWVRGQVGDLDGAIEDAERAIALEPWEPSAHHLRGIARYRKGDARGALADFDTAVERGSTDGNVFLMRGVLRGRLGDARGALEDARRAVERLPQDPEAWFLRGTARRETGDAAGARADFKKALELAPPDWTNRPGIERWLRENP